MAINALLSPAAATKTVEGDPGKTPKEAGDAFAGVFAEVVGKVPDGAGVPLTNAIPAVEPLNLAAARSADFSPPLEPGIQSGEAFGTTTVQNARLSLKQEPLVVLSATPAVADRPVPADAPKTISAGEKPPSVSKPVAGTPSIVQAVTDEKPSPKVESAPDLAEANPTPSSAPEVETQKTKVSTPRSPVARKGGAPPRKVEAPPDPPPAKSAPEAGAKTKAPNAPVERPDPISEASSNPDEPVLASLPIAIPTPQILPATPLVAMPVSITSSVEAKPSSAMPVEANSAAKPLIVSLTSGQGQATSSVSVAPAPSREATPPKALVEDLADGSKSADASEAHAAQAEPAISEEEVFAPLLQGVTIPAVARTAPDANPAPNVAPPVVLPQAPDLVGTPTIVPTVAPAQAIAAAPVPNARVAKVATDLAAPKAATPSKPTESAVKTATVAETSILVPEAATAGDQDAPDDAPKHEAPPETPLPTPSTAKTAATEKPEAGTSRPDVDRHLVVRQVADRIETLVASRPKDGLTIHLEPRDLGTVTLVVKGLQSALDVQVSASDERVRQSLDASRPELAQALAPRGIELRELRVATQSSTTSMNSSAGNGGSSANPEGRARPQVPAQAFAKPSRAEGRAPRARSNGRGVDLLV